MLLRWMYFISILQSVLSSNVSYVGDCDSLLQEFANSAADFMLCAITYARPIHLCSSCVGDYRSVVEDHDSILKISDSSNKTCKDKLTNLDRLEIIEAGFTYVTSLWDKGRCPNCFNSDGTLSNTTKEFQKMYQETEACFNEFYNQENETYNLVVCQNCSKLYLHMNKYYDSVKVKFGDGQLCMDIVDSMNITQNLWSGVLHCGEQIQTPELALVASCSTVLLIPILFYLAAWKLSSTAPAPVSRQKRLSTRFVERLRSRTGSIISHLRHSS